MEFIKTLYIWWYTHTHRNAQSQTYIGPNVCYNYAKAEIYNTLLYKGMPRKVTETKLPFYSHKAYFNWLIHGPLNVHKLICMWIRCYLCKITHRCHSLGNWNKYIRYFQLQSDCVPISNSWYHSHMCSLLMVASRVKNKNNYSYKTETHSAQKNDFTSSTDTIHNTFTLDLTDTKFSVQIFLHLLRLFILQNPMYVSKFYTFCGKIPTHNIALLDTN